MTTRRLFLLATAAATLAACGQSTQETTTTEAPAAPDPADVIRPLYQRYMTPAASTTFPTFEEQAPWSEDLWSQLAAMAARSEERQEPILDFDPIIGAQDYELSNVTVTTDAVSENSHAVVRAHFTNMGEETDVLYDMVWQNNEWRVDNIRGADWDLRQVAAG